MPDVIQYPARLQHMTDEPSYGLLIRTAARNGAIRPYSVFRRYGVHGGIGPTGVSLEDVAFTCKADADQLRHATPTLDPSAAIVMGEIFDRNQFSALTKRWCPHCLAENAYHRVWWDLVPVTTCPFHGVDLVSTCECGTVLRTVMNFHDHCRKGHSLALVDAPSAPAESLAVDGYIVRRLLGAKDQGPPHLDATTLEDVIELADQLGRALLAPDMKLGSSRRDGQRRRVLAAGYAAIADLDGKLVDALDDLVARDHRVARKWGLEKTYGRFYMWLAAYRESAARNAILDTISRHAAGRTFLKGGQVMGRDVHGEESMTIVQAAAACGLTFERFRRLAVALELVPKTWGQGTPFRLDRSVVEGLAERLRGHKDLGTVARELGMADPPTARLAREGHLETIVTGGFNQRDLNKWILHRDSALNLLKKLAVLVPRQREQGDHLEGLPMAARIGRTNVSYLLTLIFDGSLRIRGFDQNAIGLNRYLVSKSDVQVTLRRQRVPGLTMTEAIERIGIPSDTVFSFANGGLLKTKMYGRVRAVAEEEVERFIREYATIPQLAELTGLRWGQVKDRLAESGVPPAAKRPKFKQFLFERDRALEVLQGH